jgi:hypothetical protein
MVASLPLAMAACGLEDYSLARQYLEMWITMPTPLQTPRGLLTCLPIIAILYADQGEAERATELFGLVFTHPQSPTPWLDKWALLERWQSKIKASLGAEHYEQAWKRGATLDLNAIINGRFQ